MASTEQNLSVVLHGVDDLRIEPWPVREPAKGEVQIRMQTVGICGTDIHFWKKGRAGDYVIKSPMLLGHEPSGIVAALGEGVTSLKVGDRVAIEHPVPCRVCHLCKSGKYNICPNSKSFLVPPHEGFLCQIHNHPADFCYKLPENVSFEEGSLLEPLSVAVHACRRAGVTMGHKVLVLGAGTIGLLCLLVAKAAGASVVTITDINEGRLAKAKELGADHIIKVDSKDGKDVASKVIEVMGQADRTLECTAVESCIHTGVYATTAGGVLLLVGIGQDVLSIPIVDAVLREVDIRGSLGYVTNCYTTSLALVASGQVNVKPLVTHHFKLEDYLQAFETSRTAADGAIKVMVHCDQQNYGKLQGSK